MVIPDDVKLYLEEVDIPLRLSCITPSGWPVVLSLWYLYRDGQLFCATQNTAKVVGYLEREPRCAFEVASDLPPYCGVRGQARAAVDARLGAEILEQLLVRYLGGSESPLARRLLSGVQNEVAIAIQPVNMHTWNFVDRMQGSISDGTAKLCPE